MKVDQILNSKPTAGVETIPPHITVSDAAKMLSEKKIGALVVSRDGEVPIGILSERDIVRELGRRGPDCLGDKVEDLMTRDLKSCGADDGADKVLEQMTQGHFRHLPVMDGERMIGLISIGDVVKSRLSELAMERDALEGMVRGH